MAAELDPQLAAARDRLSEADLYRMYWVKGLNMREIAEKSGIKAHSQVAALMTLYGIKRRSPGRKKGQSASGLTDELVLQIKIRLELGDSQSAIAAELGLSRQAINQIAKGLTWPHVKVPEHIKKEARAQRRRNERLVREAATQKAAQQ